METPKEAYENFPKVPPEILRAWFAKYFSDTPPEEYEYIKPNFFYEVSTPALPGDDPKEVFFGRYEVGKFFDIGEAEKAAQTLYFQNRKVRIEFGEASE